MNQFIAKVKDLVKPYHHDIEVTVKEKAGRIEVIQIMTAIWPR